MRPTWAQVRQFCLAQGYQERRGNHDRYFKVIGGLHSTGTMISHGVDAETLGAQRWHQVWKFQLKLVSEEEFWKGLDGQPIQYDIPPTLQPLPEYLLRHLRDVLHWPEEQIAKTTRDEAQEILNEYHAHELRDP